MNAAVAVAKAQRDGWESEVELMLKEAQLPDIEAARAWMERHLHRGGKNRRRHRAPRTATPHRAPRTEAAVGLWCR